MRFPTQQMKEREGMRESKERGNERNVLGGRASLEIKKTHCTKDHKVSDCQMQWI